MPSEPNKIYERVASLETWRDEHKLQHDRQIRRHEYSAGRKVVVIAAIIGILAAVIGGAAGAIFIRLLIAKPS